MMLIEMSYVMDTGMPKWKTNPEDHLTFELSIGKGDPNNASSVFHHMHNGTHVDAPSHFAKDGKTIAELPIEDFRYERPLVLEIAKGRGERIEKEDLLRYEEQIAKADFLALYTGNGSLRQEMSETYVDRFPCFSPEAARYLRMEFPLLKGIAVDFVGVDSGTDGAKEGFPVHHMFLDTIEGVRTLLLYEDVNVLSVLPWKDNIKTITAYPIRWVGAEAAPVTMVAEIA